MFRASAVLVVTLLLAAAPAPAGEGVGGELDHVAVVMPARGLGQRDGVTLYRKEILSPVHVIDRIYRSMQGPVTNQEIRLGEPKPGAPPELLWVTGYGAVMTAPDGVSERSNEFMCHSNLVVDPAGYQKQFPDHLGFSDGRIFTLAQGQLYIDLPRGFGIPMYSDQVLTLNTQVLNHNIEGHRFGIRHRVRIDYVRDSDLAQPLRPLVQRGIYGLALVKGRDGHLALPDDAVDENKHGPGCLPGTDAGGGHVFSDGHGRDFTGFWVVKPGREVNRTRVTPLLALPYDTTLHAIAVHLHPFAESLELRDLTTGKSIFKSRARQSASGIGLAEVESFTSEEGIPLFKGHEYELVSIYDNTSDTDQDSMAVMYLYVLAKGTPDSKVAGNQPDRARSSP